MLLYYYLLLNISNFDKSKVKDNRNLLVSLHKVNRFIVYSTLYYSNIVFFGGTLTSNLILENMKINSSLFSHDKFIFNKWKPGKLSNILEYKYQFKMKTSNVRVENYPYITYHFNYLNGIDFRKESQARNQIDISIVPDYDDVLIRSKSREILTDRKTIDFNINLKDSQFNTLNLIASGTVHSKSMGYIKRLTKHKLKRKIIYTI